MTNFIISLPKYKVLVVNMRGAPASLSIASQSSLQ